MDVPRFQKYNFENTIDDDWGCDNTILHQLINQYIFAEVTSDLTSDSLESMFSQVGIPDLPLFLSGRK